MVPNSSRIGPKLENTNLLVLNLSPPVELFIFITEHNDDLESDLLSDTVDRADFPEEFQWS